MKARRQALFSKLRDKGRELSGIELIDAFDLIALGGGNGVACDKKDVSDMLGIKAQKQGFCGVEVAVAACHVRQYVHIKLAFDLAGKDA